MPLLSLATGALPGCLKVEPAPKHFQSAVAVRTIFVCATALHISLAEHQASECVVPKTCVISGDRASLHSHPLCRACCGALVKLDSMQLIARAKAAETLGRVPGRRVCTC